MKVAVISITRRGIALAGRAVAALPGARLHAPVKFAAEAEAAAPGIAHAYDGATSDEIGRLFAGQDAIVAIFSLGALVRMLAPHL